MKKYPILLCALICLTATVVQAHDPTAIFEANQEPQYKITLERGVDGHGYPTKVWLESMRGRVSAEELARIRKTPKDPTAAELAWKTLISDRLVTWENKIPDLALPFVGVVIPPRISIVTGTVGSLDAYMSHKYETTIFFNISVLLREYGDATSEKNRDRIDRFFAHEFTHVLHFRWQKNNPYTTDTHLTRALKTCLVEGIGHLRSISKKWHDGNDGLTPHASETLTILEPIFVRRLTALCTATDAEASELTADLAMGRFDRKWGALTVALWLADETRDDERKLRKWVKLGPKGIVTLAMKHLPEKLAVELKEGLESSGH